jgi:hypothetical protein
MAEERPHDETERRALYELRLAEAKAGRAIKKLPTLKRAEDALA